MEKPLFLRKVLSSLVAFMSLMLLFASLSWTSTGPAADPEDPDSSFVPENRLQASKEHGRFHLYFIENQGQMHQSVKFYTWGGGQPIWFTKEEIGFSIYQKSRAPEKTVSARQPGKPGPSLKPAFKTISVHLIPVGLRKRVQLLPVERQEAKVNYFRGNDPRKWRTDIPSYKAVLYQEAYRGIDLKFYGDARQLEYDIIVKPGADPQQVKFRYTGIKGLEVTEEGDLAIKLPDGRALIQKKPVVYQEIAGTRVAREGRFKVLGGVAEHTYGFEVAAYDKDFSLIIDPVLVYTYYISGTGATWPDNDSDWANGVAVDSSGSAYITGGTCSTALATVNPYQSSFQGGFSDAFVAKLNPSGDTLIYLTYLGGSGGDEAYGIAVDVYGRAHVTGYTNSAASFPTLIPLQGPSGPIDAFVTCLNANGNGLVYSTLLGGSGNEMGYGIALDTSGSIYVTGSTTSGDFPVSATPFQNARRGDSDAFVAKITRRLLFNPKTNMFYFVLYKDYASYLGDWYDDFGAGIAVDTAGNAYVTGGTYNVHEDWGVLAAKVNPAGDALLYLRAGFMSAIGAWGHEVGKGIAVDGSGNAYITGLTKATDFPTTPGAYQTSYAGGISDAFVVKLDSTGAVVYSTFLGGGSEDEGRAIAVDAAANVYITGVTRSTDFPLLHAISSTLVPESGTYYTDAFLTKLNTSGSALHFSTFLGIGHLGLSVMGVGGAYGNGIALGRWRSIYVAGGTESNIGPNTHISDIFVVKLREPFHLPLELLLLE